MGILLDIRDLSFYHPDGTKALDTVSFQLADGESVVLLGPNGSGKTTLLLHVNGTLAGQGSVQVAGLRVERRNLTEIRRRVGLVFQDADEQLFMPTVLEDVMFGLLNRGWTEQASKARAIQVLSEVGIGEELLNRPPFHLSAGEKRRVALAGVLVMEPQLLLLDEPTTSLDPPGQKSLVELLRALPQPKVIATHDIHFAAALSRRAIFLRNGMKVADGDLASVIATYGWDPYR